MKRIFTLIVLIIPMTLSAQFISVDQARERAFNFLKTQAPASKMAKKAVSKENLSLSYTYKQDNTPHIYVFSSGANGFVITSANEYTEDILGYSDHGDFNIDSLSPNFRYWMEQYDRQIAFAIAQGESLKPKQSVKAASREDVGILVATRWDQESPYYNLCPKKSSKRCLTGCVATAMAQVMKTHNWPVTGTGSHTYKDTQDSDGWGTGQTLTANFSEHTYDWDNMLNKYTGTSTSTQDSAVALLMSDCGISVNMTYGTYSEGGSGAYTEYLPYAFINYFGYDHATRHCYRDYFTDDEWSELLYTELAAGRPIMYGGSNYQGGHSFICDGYQKSTGKFHFNFGWSGQDDGYFALSAIGSERYTYYNDAVIGIQPEAGGKAMPSIIFYDDCYLESNETKNGDYTTYALTFGKYKYNYQSYDGFIWNDTWCKADVLFTMKYTNEDTGEVYYAEAKDDEANRIEFGEMYDIADYPYMESLTVKDVIVPKLPAGNYHVSLAYKQWAEKDSVDTPWQDVKAFTSAKNYVDLTIESTIDAPEAKEATDITDSSFTANWSPVADAVRYTLELTATDSAVMPDTTLLSEDFELVGGSGTKDVSSSLDQFTNAPGWTGSKIYCGDERFKVGSSNSGWWIATPTLTLTEPNRVKVIITEAKYSNDTPTFTTEITDTQGNTIRSQTEQATGKDSKPVTHELYFENISGDFKVKFSNSSSKQRLYIDDIKVIAGGASKSAIRTYEDITDTCYNFTNLSADTIYQYRIRALSPYDMSKWSESVKVVLASPSTILGDANGDNKIDVADITAIASFILGATPGNWYSDNADVNKDGKIDVADITGTAAIILGN